MPVPSDNITNITDRPNYYAGQYLLEDDFELEQQYHIDRLRRHHRLLHIAGIVHGLEVSWADNNTKLQVTAGTAIDADGRQIVLAQDKVNIAMPEIATNGTILFILYKSSEFSNQGSTASQPEKDSGPATTASTLIPAEGKNRIKEEPLIDWGITVPKGGIALAKVITTKELDFSDRVYSGIRLPSPFNTLGEGLTLRYKGNGKSPTANQLELVEFTGNLSITGNVGIGTSAADAELAVNGNIKATKETSTGTLAVTGTSTLTGNVGIGTLKPEEILDIGDFTSTGSNAYLRIKTQGGSKYKAGIKLQHYNDGYGFLLESDEQTNSFRIKGYEKGVEKDLLFISRGDSNVGIGTAEPKAKLAINGGLHVGGDSDPGDDNLLVDGNVGIGTSPTPPKNKLHVGSGASTIAIERVDVVIAAKDKDTGIAIARDNVNLLLQASGAGGYIGTTSTHPLVLRTNDTDRLTISKEGIISAQGPIMEKVDVIDCKGSMDWGKKNHPVKEYFYNKLNGKPTGTLIRAVANHPEWDRLFWTAWVDRDNKVRIIHSDDLRGLIASEDS